MARFCRLTKMLTLILWALTFHAQNPRQSLFPPLRSLNSLGHPSIEGALVHLKIPNHIQSSEDVIVIIHATLRAFLSSTPISLGTTIHIQ